MNWRTRESARAATLEGAARGVQKRKEEEVMADLNTIVDQLSGLSIMETTELVKKLKKK